MYAGSALDSARIRGALTIASQNFKYQTAIVHLEGGALRRAKPNTFYDTWQDQSGLRLYPAHAFTGTRTVWFTFEDRIVVSDQAFGLVGVGVAPFSTGVVHGSETSRCGRKGNPRSAGADANGKRCRNRPPLGSDPSRARRRFGIRGGLPVRRSRGRAARLGTFNPPGYSLLARLAVPSV